jgi:hypothetical protein
MNFVIYTSHLLLAERAEINPGTYSGWLVGNRNAQPYKASKRRMRANNRLKYLHRDGQGLFSRYYVSIYLKELKKSTKNAIRIADIPTLNIMNTKHKYYTLDRNAE